MIKVLQVVGKMHYGGMETLIMNIYRTIDRSKVQFDFLVHYEDAGEYDEEIRRLGGTIYVMPKTTPNNFFRCRRAYRDFFVEHHEYAKVHIHLHNIAFLLIPEAKKYRIPSIVHLHNSGVEKNLKGYLGVFCTKRGLPMADSVFACSKESGEFFLSKGGKSEFRVIKNGIIGERFFYQPTIREEMRRELQLDHSYVLLCTARFFAQKNHLFLIEIMKELVSICPDARLLLVGEGPLEEAIREKVKEYELQDVVSFLGVRSDVNHLMQAADCFVMPSLWEGLALSYIEAQAAGLKVYTSAEALSREACITDLVETRSVQEEAAVWATMIAEGREYDRINQKDAMQRSGFDIEQTTAFLEKFYGEG